MRDEFTRRLSAAAKGQPHDDPRPVDDHLRALVTQLTVGTAAQTPGTHQLVGDKPHKPGNGG